MGWEAVLVVAVIVAAVALFVADALRADLVALLALAVLLVAGIVPVAEGFAGFASPATITVAAMFVLSAGLRRTGAVRVLGTMLARLGRRGPRRALAALSVGTSGVSAFVNNTAAVAVLLPSVLEVARETRTAPSKLLIPLSYASLFGGVCTLIGTSTNILVSALAEKHGQPPIGMFELAPVGLVLFAVGTAYMLVIGYRLLPERGVPDDLTDGFEMSDYLFELRLQPEAASVGTALADAPLVREHDLDVIALVRDGEVRQLPAPSTVLHAGDLLRVRGDMATVRAMERRQGVELRPRRDWRDATVAVGEQASLAELVVAPGSALAGRTLREIGFRNRFGATVLAIRHHDRLLHTGLADTRLQGGDALLVDVPSERAAGLGRGGDFVVVSQRGTLAEPARRAGRALAVVVAVVVAAAAGWAPVAVAAVVGAVAMVLLGCLSLEEAYGSLDARVLVLLGAILPVGTALERTGVAEALAGGLARVAGGMGPVAALAAVYALTSLMTEVMSNNATTVLVVPLALELAASLGVDARPFLMAVAFAASASFMTPVGYQTNTLVYGPGAYRFSDYLRVGTPLNVLFWVVAVLLVPVVWPF